MLYLKFRVSFELVESFKHDTKYNHSTVSIFNFYNKLG